MVSFKVKRTQSILLSMILSCSLQGCSTDWRADPQPTSGSLTINGSPPAKAIVMFRSLGEKVDSAGTQPYARVSDDGTFEMTTYKPNDGAPAGEYAVCIRWPKVPNTPSEDRLGEAYWPVEKAVTQVKIERGDNVIPPIKLENVKLK